MPIKVLIVDDSALIRSLLTQILNHQEGIAVVGAAPDPYAARELIKQLNPDVLTLDVEMPRMDGLEFLEKLMRLRPMPVVMISSLTEEGSEITFRALELGAVDFIAKPKLGIQAGLEAYAETIAEKIRAAAQAHPRPIAPAPPASRASPAQAGFVGTEKVLMIAASTGGTEAIREVLQGLPPDAPGILIAQHMPPGFTRSFAQRMDRLTGLTVREAQGGERLLPGHVYIAPGDAHLCLARSGANYVTELSQAPPVNRHRPSCDVLFDSAARTAGANAFGLILTGMGKDGAAGLLAMRQAGAWTLAQDEASCVVYGMPKEAAQIGAACDIAPLEQIAERLLAQWQKNGRGNRV
ncbi:MAG: chemotaxis response regulator protein-glutamate methylesterase [Gammaproteobacteria bacterium]|nr:chemotaxis response regulator protein-glutamate methylesterase [Gammaproteobacteria bacterium]